MKKTYEQGYINGFAQSKKKIEELEEQKEKLEKELAKQKEEIENKLKELGKEEN